MLNAFFRPILLILLFCSFAEAWPPTYGAEYQFTNNEFPIGALANADAKKPNGVAARAAAKMAAGEAENKERNRKQGQEEENKENKKKTPGAGPDPDEEDEEADKKCAD